MTPSEADCLIAVNRVPNVGAAKVAALRRAFGSLAAVREVPGEEVALRCKEIGPKLSQQIVEALNSDFAEAERERAQAQHVQILTAQDAAWPAALRELSSPPLCLYCAGDVRLLAQTQVAMVGTRRASVYGMEQARRFALGVAAAGCHVTSGLAEGIDSAAHEGALQAGEVGTAAGKTIAVIGAALDRLYPASRKPLARQIVQAGGLVVSEYAFGRNADRQTFPARNRLVAALARAVLAVETPHKSGTMITIELAEALARPLFALPGRLDWPSFAGNHALIRSARATLATHPEEILSALGSLPLGQGSAAAEVPALPELTGDERRIYEATTLDGVSLDALCASTGLPINEVMNLAIALQMRRRLRALPGGLVARVPGARG